MDRFILKIKIHILYYDILFLILMGFVLLLECIPPSLRFFSGNEQVDLARKMQEDPLYAIKKKEVETRNQLLKNPVKLKQLGILVCILRAGQKETSTLCTLFFTSLFTSTKY